jgi:4-amino-4-deoxy-L-arabinose transferase-like glycosyltransferase
VAAIIWFALLGYRDLIEPDEGRYSEIPREMIESGDWVTPRLNGFKYFEKPPLQYWATAAVFTIFGESDATARLWIALAGFLGAGWIGFVARRLYDTKAGFCAGVVAGSCLLYTAMSHTITLDLTLTVFLAVSVCSLVLAQIQRENKSHVARWMMIGWAALACATLTKGLIGLVLPTGAVVVYTVWQRDWALWRHLHIGKGLLVFLALTVPWFVAVSLKNPEFPEFFFIHEHLERYTTTTHSRYEPPWHFFPVFLLGMFPWTFIAIKTLVKPGFRWRGGGSGSENGNRARGSKGFNAERFLWVFAVVVFVFFSFGQSKMWAYILPIFPVIAILVGRKLSVQGLSRVDVWTIAGLAAAFFVAAWLAPGQAKDEIRAELARVYRPWIIAAACSLALASAAGFGALRTSKRTRTDGPGRLEEPKRRIAPVASVALFAILAVQCLLWGYHSQSPLRSSRQAADAIAPYITEDTEIFSLRRYPQSLPFYIRRIITLVDVEDELKMGIEQEPEKWIATLGGFERRWLDADQAIALMDRGEYDKFEKNGLPMKLIFTGPKQIAVLKPAGD